MKKNLPRNHSINALVDLIVLTLQKVNLKKAHYVLMNIFEMARATELVFF